ncbi:HofP DNA utilization family protein [Pantoea phytobeneficialis]|uniref:HofP DNA utilization family protein n=1 Tax=Pantoea phytobeneficialis TaxID=2052056 RepID=A0AAP9H7W7_9GAMM|nr:HofP DNA utilization family protein [Pantoea phytobeneficialis]MDO6407897.1 HofP DNA utilization family protein [Pantoea phytobeneficialis]QGR08355.1 hypothetical protein CTZ24_18785 [Pantoea phytobeneficialis]
MRVSVLLCFLLGSPAVLARDPFQPMAPVFCQSTIDPPQGWRLQGIVGIPDHYVAWLRSPQGKNVRLEQQMQLPQTPWRVQHLTARSLLLLAEQSCSPQQIQFRIKGGFYVTEDAMDAGGAVSERAIARQ